MKPNTILIVDDNKGILTSLELLLEGHFDRIITLSNPNQIPATLQTASVDLVILDMNFTAEKTTGNEGLYWLKTIHTFNPNIPVIMLTAYGDIDLAVTAIKQQAADFIQKPWDNDLLLSKVKAIIKERKEKTTSPVASEMLIGKSAAMKKLMQTVEKVAPTTANILITGENGTGKDLLAQTIHKKSNRQKFPLVCVDMGAISESLFESELFGHEKGAFTDAYQQRYGKFEAANKGTLFMDEIGNLNLQQQTKLLRALQNRTITRIGSNTPVSIDVRIIAATNTDLEKRVIEGTFREDLLYRLNTIHLEIPPLRERKEDIPLFVHYFLHRFNQQYHKQCSIHNDQIEKLTNYSWPGNIRQLQHLLEKAVILADSERLILPEAENEAQWKPATDEIPVPPLEEVEKQAILTAFKQNQGNIRATADQLKVSRQTLYNKLKRFHF